MPVMRQASLMRTVMGRAMDRSSWLLLLLGKGGCFTAVGPPQLLLDQLYKAEIARPPRRAVSLSNGGWCATSAS